MSALHHDATAHSDRRLMELQQSSDFQAALLGMAGHDLRQPLQIIQSAYEWLGTRVAHTSEQARLERGERAIAKLTEQLDRLLGALRLYEHTQKMETTNVKLAPLFWRIANENRVDAFEKGIDLRIHETDRVVMSHPVLLDGILRNLVRNAVKYTETGGRILIGCRRVERDLRIDVYDTGVGISPERMPDIFDAFRRIDSTRPDGLGIGLFVVRRAVQLLGHRIEVRSRPGHGSRFSVFAAAAD